MTPLLWSRRAAALAILVCGVLTVGGVAKAYSAWSDVRASEKELAELQGPLQQGQVWVAPKPTLRSGAATTETAVNDALRRALDFGGEPTITVSTARALGGGLRLVEATIALQGDTRTLEALAQWGAVNRDSVRVADLGLTVAADGKSRVTARMMMVIA